MIRSLLRERGVAVAWQGLTLVVGFATVLLVGSSWLLTPAAAPSAFETKQQTADTLLLYEIRPGEAVRIASRAGQQLFYVVSHMMLPATQVYDPDAEFEYALDATFNDKQGRVVAEHVFWERSRQSKADPHNGGWLQENAFLAPGHGELTDDRVTMLGVETILPDGGHITVSSKETTKPVLLRIYSIEERPDIDRLKRYKLLPERRKETMAHYMGYDSLEQLSLTDLLVLFQRKWERVEGQTANGEAPRTRRVFYQGFRLARTALDDAVLDLAPGRKAAFNVAGPTSLHLVFGEPQTTAPPLWLSGLSVTGAQLTTQATMWQGDVSQAFAIPDGLWSLTLDNRTQKASTVKVAFPQAPSRSIGNARLAPDATKRYQAFLLPERIDQEGFITNQDTEVRFSALGFAPSQLLVLELRALVDGAPDVQPRRFSLTYYDNSGQALRTFETEATPTVSHFEWLVRAEGQRSWVSDTFDVLVAPPPGTRSVGLRSGRPLFARAFVENEAEFVEDEVYPAVASPLVWRLRRLPRPGWTRVDPMNRGQLAESGQVAKIVGQTRFEQLGERDAVAPAWRAATVRGRAHTEILLAEVLPAQDPAAVSDNRGLRLACRPDRKVPTALVADPSGNNMGILDITYYVPPSLALGGLIEVEQEGRTVAKVVPATRLDTVRVRRLRRTGELTWRHGFPGGDPRIFIRVAPGKGRIFAPPAGCQAYKSFTVTRVPPGGTISLAVNADPQQPSAVNIVVYGQGGLALQATIDQGKLKRSSEPRIGRPTRSQQDLALEWQPGATSSFLLTRPYESLQTSQTVFVQLGSDLTKGTHTLTLRNPGTRELWLRAFQAAQTPEKKASVEVKRLQ